MRTVTLELLRHGPAHNQLLSPLTQYLALCGNHGAVSLNVPFEHNQLLHRLRSLEYQTDEASRQFQLKDSAQELCGILGKIPGLLAELGKETGSGQKLTHLRLIVSASELALLPFELANSPSGCPGAGQQLVLQSQLPLCLTREVRRSDDNPVNWPTKPRILFVAASPPDCGAVPLESHLLALRRVIEPWVNYYDDLDERKRRVSEYLTVLPRASADAIQRECAAHAYTHVHILAHGKEYFEGDDRRYGLALHNSRNPSVTDIVSGPRLATLLRVVQPPDSQTLGRPTIVTLASCSSGSVGSVAGAGASIAHALHEAGIPMVVASQFPLSFAGSVIMVEVLYEGLLFGTDPRALLADLRRQLQSRLPQTHDWASIVAYASLPPDLPEQLLKCQIEQAQSSIDSALADADRAVWIISKTFERYSQSQTSGVSRRRQPIQPKRQLELIERANKKVELGKRRLLNVLEQAPSERSLICLRLASIEKREAQLLFRRSQPLSGAGEEAANLQYQVTEDEREGLLDRSRQALERSCDGYRESFEADRLGGWALAQFLSLAVVLERENANLGDLWVLARGLSENDLKHEAAQRAAAMRESLAGSAVAPQTASSESLGLAAWAHANLLELYLLVPAIPILLQRIGHGPPPELPPSPVALEKAISHTRELVSRVGEDSFAVKSTRRQLVRYCEWFNEISPTIKAVIEGAAYQVLEALPKKLSMVW